LLLDALCLASARRSSLDLPFSFTFSNSPARCLARYTFKRLLTLWMMVNAIDDCRGNHRTNTEYSGFGTLAMKASMLFESANTIRKYLSMGLHLELALQYSLA
jgi:hypothetical protein